MQIIIKTKDKITSLDTLDKEPKQEIVTIKKDTSYSKNIEELNKCHAEEDMSFKCPLTEPKKKNGIIHRIIEYIVDDLCSPFASTSVLLSIPIIIALTIMLLHTIFNLMTLLGLI